MTFGLEVVRMVSIHFCEDAASLLSVLIEIKIEEISNAARTTDFNFSALGRRQDQPSYSGAYSGPLDLSAVLLEAPYGNLTGETCLLILLVLTIGLFLLIRPLLNRKLS